MLPEIDSPNDGTPCFRHFQKKGKGHLIGYGRNGPCFDFVENDGSNFLDRVKRAFPDGLDAPYSSTLAD